MRSRKKLGWPLIMTGMGCLFVAFKLWGVFGVIVVKAFRNIFSCLGKSSVTVEWPSKSGLSLADRRPELILYLWRQGVVDRWTRLPGEVVLGNGDGSCGVLVRPLWSESCRTLLI